MKHTLLLCLLVASASATLAQNYDSAVHYLMTPSYFVAMDTLIARAATPTDTGEESETEILTRERYFTGSRISLDVPMGADIMADRNKAVMNSMAYFGVSCAGKVRMGLC